MKIYRFYVGIDWADQAHQVSLRESGTERIEEKSFEHSGAGLGAMIEWLTTATGERCERWRTVSKPPRDVLCFFARGGPLAPYVMTSSAP